MENTDSLNSGADEAGPSQKDDMPFDTKCGEKLLLFNANLTITRSGVEASKGLVLTKRPLTTGVPFHIEVEKVNKSWPGNFEFGVTTLSADKVDLELPASRLLKSFILAENYLIKDGCILNDNYGPNLSNLKIWDCLSVLRTDQGHLEFFWNGESLGIAAEDIPETLYAVAYMNGKVSEISSAKYGLCPELYPDGALAGSIRAITNEIEEDYNAHNSDDDEHTGEVKINMPVDNYLFTESRKEKIRFHPKCGVLIELGPDFKTATRKRPIDDYNNGIVMTSRPLDIDELFVVRIDRLVDKWSGSVEVGVTTHNPARLRFPSTMTNVASGTIMMTGGKILENGKSTFATYGNINLDELKVGETVGMIRKATGYLHYIVNGVDQGPAVHISAPRVWGVVDLYGMTVQVTIVDDDEEEVVASTSGQSRESVPEENESSVSSRPQVDEEMLLFHSLCDKNVIILNDGKTAHRLNANELFGNGTVITSRPLRSGEIFQVRLDLMVSKWIGTISIAVTTNPHNEMPFRKVSSGHGRSFWAIQGEGLVKPNSPYVSRSSASCYNQLQEGDVVGIMRNDDGAIHVYINGVDQGYTTFEVPELIYVVVDLYGKAAQVSIHDQYVPPPAPPRSPCTSESQESTPTIPTIFPDLCFNGRHGANVRLSRTHTTAYRISLGSAVKDCVLFSSRALRECELFEIRIDRTYGAWKGFFEIGATSVRPEELEALNKGVEHMEGTYTLRGRNIICDERIVAPDYDLDITAMPIGAKIGVMVHADKSLHFYMHGIDQGKAIHLPCLDVYAVIFLHGQVGQITVTSDDIGLNVSESIAEHAVLNQFLPNLDHFSFSEYCGDNVYMSSDCVIAKRRANDISGAMVFSSHHIEEEPFEITIVACENPCAGSMRVGLTDSNILNAMVNRNLPPDVSCLPHYTAFIDGQYLKKTRPGVEELHRELCDPNFDELSVGDKISLWRDACGINLALNDVVVWPPFDDVPEKVYAVFEIFGSVTAIRALSVKQTAGMSNSDEEIFPMKGIKKMDKVVVLAEEATSFSPEKVPCTSPENLPSASAEYVPPISVDYDGSASAENAPSSPEEKAFAGSLPFALVETGPSALGENVPSTLSENAPSDLVENPPSELAGNVQLASAEEVTCGSAEDAPCASTEEVAGATQGIDERDSDDTETEEEGSDDEGDPEEVKEEEEEKEEEIFTPFHEVHGRYIKISTDGTNATRYTGYDNGVVFMRKPLLRGQCYRFRIDRIKPGYASGLTLGAVGKIPSNAPRTGLNVIGATWLISPEVKITEDHVINLGEPNSLEKLIGGSLVSIEWHEDSNLVVKIINGEVFEVAKVPDSFTEIFCMVDINGQVESITVVRLPKRSQSASSEGDIPSVPAIDAAKAAKSTAPVHDSDDSDDEDDERPGSCRPSSSQVLRKNFINETMHRSQSLNLARNKYVEYKSYRTLSDLADYAAANVGCNFLENLLAHRDDTASSGYGNLVDDDEAGIHDEISSLDSDEVLAAIVGRTLKWPVLNDPTVDDDSDDEDYSPENDEPLPPLSTEFVYSQSLLAEVLAPLEPNHVFQAQALPNCYNVKASLVYCAAFVPDFFNMVILGGKISCYCEKCAPGAENDLKGWVKLERPDNGLPAVGPKSYFTVADHTVLLHALTAEDLNMPPSPPDADAFTVLPHCVDYCFALWHNDKGEGQRVFMTLEIERSGENYTKDRLTAILLRSNPIKEDIEDQ